MEDRTGEVVFFQDNVIVHTAGPLKGEDAYSGKLMIVKEPHGSSIEWHPVQQVTVTQSSSPEGDNLEWEDVSSAIVGYKADPKCGENSVEIKTGNKSPKLVSFDISDIKSFRREEKSECNRVEAEIIATFFLRDGSTIHSFHFEDATAFSGFIQSLTIYVSFKRSKKDGSLYLIDDKKSKSTEKSFNEVELFDANKTHIVAKLIKEPYETAMGGFSKVTGYLMDYVLNSNETESASNYHEDEIAEMLSESLPRVDINHHQEPGYELITCIQLPPRPTAVRGEAVSHDEWHSHFDPEGRISEAETLKHRIFKGGLMHSVRCDAWKYLLGYYSFETSSKERELMRKQKVDDYYRMKLQWKSITSDQESRFAALRERRSLIEKDVSRTDRTHPFYEGESNVNIQMLYDILMTYCMYNFDLGYVQGMSDLLSPILVVMQNEADAFWCFSGWMEKVGINFEMDQQGIKNQLQSLHRLVHFVDSQLCSYLETHESGNMYFAFRWLLILFKRDFKFQEIMRLWEVLWTDMPCKNFHLLICVAILDTEKSTIMENNYGLTEVLKHVNDMAYKINLDDTLCKAEAIYHQIRSCKQHTSDVVQDILGIQGSLNVEQYATETTTEERKTEVEAVRRKNYDADLLKSEVRCDESQNRRIMCSSNINDFVELDGSPYAYPFDLYTA